LNIIKVGRRYVNLDLLAHAYESDKDDRIILVLAVPDHKAVGGVDQKSVGGDYREVRRVTGNLTVAFRGDEARQVREALDIAAAMNRWERAT
jgi:hypothetical protein